jgi:predicted dienelactone hydrolase
MTSRATRLLPTLGWIAALLCASACVYASPTTPALHGEFSVGTVAADWLREVEGSNRRLKIRIWYPARQASASAQARRYLDTAEAQRTIESIERFLEAPGSLSMLADARTQSFENAPIAADGSYAVVLFNHGFWFYLAQNTALMENLASHGYVAVSVAHPGDSMAVHYANGSVVETIPYVAEERGPGERAFFSDSSHAARVESYPAFQLELRDRRVLQSLRTWRADLRAVLDDLQAGAVPGLPVGLRDRMDFSKIAFAGMSFGGAVAASACAVDARCDAAINLDGFQYDAALFDRDFGKPLLMVNSDWVTHRIDARPQSPELAIDDYFYERFERAGLATDLYRVRVRNLRHLGFTDLPWFAPAGVRASRLGGLDPAQAVSGVNEMILAFCDRYVRHRQQAFPGAFFRRHPDFIRRDAAQIRRWRTGRASSSAIAQ